MNIDALIRFERQKITEIYFLKNLLEKTVHSP